jgi:uncharacterized protein (TIGR02646 family)
MRPIHRGNVPGVGGLPKAYTRYQEAIGDLEDRLGVYCSYCERRLPASLEVEHVSPKSIDPAHERDWNNFLLGCKNCNTVKGSKPTNIPDFLWPDRDNTFLAFKYSQGGFVAVQDNLGADVNAKATALCNLIGLDRHKLGGAGKKPRSRDKRWKDREQIWKLAEDQKARLQKFPTDLQDAVRTFIADSAEGFGCFSVWMTVFHDDPKVCAALVQRMPATTQSQCFNANGQPISRVGGRI